MWRLDHAHPCRALLMDNLVTKSLHSCPMDLRPEMMFGVVTVKKPSPVVEFAVGAHAPRNRLIRIATVMPIVAVQIRQAVAKVPEWQKETDVMPVKDTEDNKCANKQCELGYAPKRLARILPFQLFKHGLGIFAKETQERVFEWTLGLAVVAVFVNRNPIDGLTVLVRPGRRFPCDAACECIRRRFG